MVIASVVIPPCSVYNYGDSLYFTAGGTREAITNSLDLRGLYAITFTLQIGSFDNKCDQAEAGDDVILYYLLSGSSNWVELRTFDAAAYTRATTVTVPIPHRIRLQGTKLRWAQPQHSGLLEDTWFIDNVGVYSPNQCPPMAYSEPAYNPAVTPSPIPNVAITCHSYSDDFNTLAYKTHLWHTVDNAAVQSPTCTSSAEGYVMVLQRSGQLITQMLNLRKIESISFFSKSCYRYHQYWYYDTYGYRRYARHFTNGTLTVAYRISGVDSWNNLETLNYTSSSEGTKLTVYLPTEAQVDLVQLRWQHMPDTGDTWMLDDVQIGENIHTILYQDAFTNYLNSAIWSSVTGGSVSIPPCGSVDNGMALFFSQTGVREAITEFLDLRQAQAVSFYIATTFSTNCNGLDNGETIELSIRVDYGEWITIQSYSSTSSTYFYEEIPENMRVNSAQLRWAQTVPAMANYDVWAIDSIEIHSIYPRTACSVSCFSDNFDSGAYNTSIWSSISGAQFTTVPCSTKFLSKALYFNMTNARHAITHPLDLQGMYAISFYLQIVRSDEICDAVNETNVIVYYTTNGNENWIEIGSFGGIKFVTETLVTVPLPREARNQSISIRIVQQNYIGSVSSIDNFGIYSPDQCPPLSVMQTSPVMPPTTTPPPSTSLHCNYYWDNFDSGTFKSTLWSSQTDAEVVMLPCQSASSLNWYGIKFMHSAQIATQALDLSGVDFISFHLLSGNGSNGCNVAYRNFYVSYRIDLISSWNILEYFTPSCCRSGKQIVIYIPPLIKIPSVYLRWHVSSYSDHWVLDNIKIGNSVETYLYSDEFTNNYDHSLWVMILGAVVTEPPCGATYSGSALYFSKGGKREGVTHILDLRDARKVTFNMRIGSGTNICEEPEEGEDIEFSYRINYNSWVTLQTFPATQFRDSTYVDITITEELQMIGVQFRFRQLVQSFASYDVWSIDHFAIISVEQDTKCSMACYSDNFNSGSYNSELWSSVIASVTIPPCSVYNYGDSLYCTAGGTREAITNSLDLRGLYAITFTLQIGSYGNKCDPAEAGDDVILYYLLSSNSIWVELRTFDATAYKTATTVTVPIPSKARSQGVQLRWAQPQHSGSLQDTWFIDNVGIYSPNQCPPVAYSEPALNPIVIPSPTSTLTTCSYYFDDFNDGTYKTSALEYCYWCKSLINTL